MRDKLHKALKPIKDKSGLWWLFLWKWPALLRECHGEIGQLESDLGMVREQFRSEQARCDTLERLGNESREIASAAMNRASAEKSLSQNLSEELENAKVQLQKSSETVGGLENRVARMEMESERLKAELAKTQADLTRSGLELERETRRNKDALRDLTLLREFVHRTHRLDIPTRRGVKALLANGNRLIMFLALLLPLCIFAQFPPPFFRGVYTTNTATWANTNVISLSTTNATSKPLTNHYQDGVLTLFGLQAGANITLSVNGSNIVISSTGGGSEIFFNANQFLPSATHTNIRAGALLTNTIHWQSNALLPALIATNQPGGTIDLVIMFATNTAGLRVSSNGTVVVRGGAPLGGASLYMDDGANPVSEILTFSTPTLVLGGPDALQVRIGHSTDAVIFDRSVKPEFFPLFDGTNDLGLNGAAWREFWARKATLGGDAMLLPLAVTNMPGSTLDLSTMLTTNAAGLRVTSNGTVVARGVNVVGLIVTNNPGSTRNLLEVYNTNQNGFKVPSNGVIHLRGSASGDTPVLFVENTEANQTYTIWTNGVGGNGSFIMRTDNAGNAVFSPGQAAGQTFFGGPDSGSGIVNFNLVTVGAVWRMVPSADVAAWHSSTLRRGQITNVWDIWGRTNLWLTRTGLLNGIVVTQDIRFLGHNSASNALWTCTNTTTGEGEWRYNAALFQPATTTLTNLSGTGAVTNVVSLSTTNATSKPLTNHFENGILTLYGLEAGANISLSDNGSNIVITGSAGGGGLTTNANQFGAQVVLTIKEGALLTNTLFYPSNLTGPAIIATATTAQVTNLVEWRSTNGTINISVSSNANAIVYGRLDMSNAVAFRTNNIDFRLPVYQAFTNALQTNLVLQLTNTYEGVTHRIDAYGSGRLGNGRTNAWQLFCTVASGTTIYWPPGTTNGNFDVLVNSNQVVSLTFSGGLGATNIIAEYRIREGIGVN